jgi:hypothetical protein
MVHVRRRVVEAQWELLLLRRFGQHRDDVLLVGRPGDLVGRVRRVEHAEAVVVLAREDHVALPGSLGELYPRPRIELLRIESLR